MPLIVPKRLSGQPVAFFGGKEAFRKTQERDRRKRRRCKRNGVRPIYVREGYSLPEVIQQVRSEESRARWLNKTGDRRKIVRGP